MQRHFSFLINLQSCDNPVFALSLWWVGCRFMWKKSNLKQFNITQHNKMWKNWRGMKTFYRHCICAIHTITAAILHLHFPALLSRGISFSFHMELCMDTGHDHGLQGDVTLRDPSQTKHTLGQCGPESVQVTDGVWRCISLSVTIVCVRQSNPQQLKTRLDSWRHFDIPQITVQEEPQHRRQTTSHITLR